MRASPARNSPPPSTCLSHLFANKEEEEPGMCAGLSRPGSPGEISKRKGGFLFGWGLTKSNPLSLIVFPIMAQELTSCFQNGCSLLWTCCEPRSPFVCVCVGGGIIGHSGAQHSASQNSSAELSLTRCTDNWRSDPTSACSATDWFTQIQGEKRAFSLKKTQACLYIHAQFLYKAGQSLSKSPVKLSFATTVHMLTGADSCSDYWSEVKMGKGGIFPKLENYCLNLMLITSACYHFQKPVCVQCFINSSSNNCYSWKLLLKFRTGLQWNLNKYPIN